MKKFLAAMSLLTLINFSSCNAATVHAVGRGINERMAVRDAMRNAIEQTLGATVNSRTRTKNSMLVADEIAVDSAGLISRWQLISNVVEGGIFVVKIIAELDDKKISARLTELERKALVDFNADNPRVAVVAFGSNGQRVAAVENEIINALKRQGFTRTVDLSQINRTVRQRIYSAAGDVELCKTLANDFHTDCLVVAQVNFSSDNEISVSSRLIELNTGEIIFAGNSTGGGMFTNSSDALKVAGRRAGNELSLAALKSAAQVERHITLLITSETFNRLGGTLTAVSERIRNLSGVNDAFARKMTSSLELDVDFDGTAADFAKVLESNHIRIIELGSAYIKI